MNKIIHYGNTRAKRIDNVKGFDSAHKECAKNSETDYLITVDGDNCYYLKY